MELLHLSGISSLLVILTTTVTVAQLLLEPFARSPIIDQNGTTLQRPHECDEDDNCSAFSYCAHRWAGNFCRTNLRTINPNDSVNCDGTDHSCKSFPVHMICIDHEVNITSGKVTNETSTMRCFPQLNFTCAKSYYMPCTPNYNSDGSVITGQEEACPEKFSCSQKSYGPQKTPVKLCLPDETEREGGNYDCKTAFDCGYSQLEGKWSICNQGGECEWITD